MKISACYCENCGRLRTYWVIHEGELFECQCGSLKAKCVAHFFDASFLRPEDIPDRIINTQGEALVSIRQSQISLEWLETICQQFGFVVKPSALQQMNEIMGKEKHYAKKELRNEILVYLISALDKETFYCHWMAYKDAQGLANLIRTYTPRVDTDGLWRYLQGIHLPLLFKFRAKRLEKHIEKHCYVDRRERFLFTEDFKVALKEYKKGFKIVVQDDGGLMGHGGISEVFELPEPSPSEQALNEFTQFCRQRKSKYYYFIHYRSDTE